MSRRRVSVFCSVPRKMMYLPPVSGLLWKGCWLGAEGGVTDGREEHRKTGYRFAQNAW